MQQAATGTAVRAIWRGIWPALAGLALLVSWLLLWQDGALLQWGLLGLARSLLTIALVALLYLVPGMALLRLLLPGLADASGLQHPLARPLLALCLSTALPPLLLLLFAQVGLPWNRFTIWGYLLLSALLLVVPLSSGQHRQPGRAVAAAAPNRSPADLEVPGTTLALVLVGLLVLLVRLYVVRELPTGLLGDSYHHTMVTHLLVENSGLFQSWQPYAPLTTLTYHFGFQANAATVHWLTGLSVPQSVLWTGQVFNTFSVLSLFVLVVALRGTPWAGVWAVVVAGFWLSMPGYLVNWGRYTQLTGHVVLVAVLVGWIRLGDQTAQQALQHPFDGGDGGWRIWLRALAARQWRWLLLVVLVTVALMLTHYRITLLAAVWIASYLTVLVLVQRSLAGWLALAVLAGGACLLALLLAIPWLYTVLQGHLVRNTAAFVSGEMGADRVAAVSALPAVHPLFVKGSVLALACAGLLLAGWQRHWRIALPGLWFVLLILCVVPHIIALPGRGVIDQLTAYNGLYLLAAPLAGVTLAALQAGALALLARWRVPPSASMLLVALALAGSCILGMPQQAAIIQKSESGAPYAQTQLVTPADMQAMAWIRANTAPDARFLVNSFPAYGGTLVVGSDAGWWLPLLTKRSSTLPPITYASEQSADPAYHRQINQLAEALRQRPLTDATAVAIDLTRPEALQTLRQAGIDYVYAGAHASPAAGSVDSIDTAVLREHSAFELVYAREGVEIFRLAASAAQELTDERDRQ